MTDLKEEMEMSPMILTNDDAASNVYIVEEIAEAYDEGVRLDLYLSKIFPSLSRNLIQKSIKNLTILINGTPKKSSDRIKTGDIISGYIANEPILTKVAASNIPIDIIFEDSDIIIVNKPSGMVVHPAPGHTDDTLVNALLYHLKDNISNINGNLRPGIVHRIDRDTSGLLVCAKNNNAHLKLQEQLAAHTVTRKYEAICFNAFDNSEGVIDAPIGRSHNDRKKMAIDFKNGRRAVTHYRVLEELGSFTRIECILETGRTHQIRVHMKSIGHPLVGDPVYSNANLKFQTKGQLLHAGVLGFLHPANGKYIEFKAEPPSDYLHALDIIKKINS